MEITLNRQYMAETPSVSVTAIACVYRAHRMAGTVLLRGLRGLIINPGVADRVRRGSLYF
jgi:hypothetical protein